MLGRVLVRASQTVTCIARSQSCHLGPVAAEARAHLPLKAYLLGLRACLKQTLLDCKLQQVIVLISKGLAALSAQHAIPLGHLKHSGIHLAWERAPWAGGRGTMLSLQGSVIREPGAASSACLP